MKTVAVIGSGCSGLTALKCCLDEGLEATCFERTDDIGGLWHYTEDIRPGQGCVMKSTVATISKEVSCYSDFPPPKEFPVYLRHEQYKEYFELYAKKFSLRKHIEFEKEIVMSKPTDDFAESGQWELEIKDRKSGTTDKRTFDAVMIAVGNFTDKLMPEFPGQEDFKGEIIHSVEYKRPTGFEGKRVVVVGIGSSGSDISVELSRCCEKVFLSTRRGAWIYARLSPEGIPFDMTILRRYVNYKLNHFLPSSISRAIYEDIWNSKIDHTAYGLKPTHSPAQEFGHTNDDIPFRIACGSIIIKPNVRRFTQNGIEFDDGTIEDNIDIVIMATGYNYGCPFLDKSVKEVKTNDLSLYKCMFPPSLKKQTLALIGHYQPAGPMTAFAEMQSRLATRVFKGLVHLPSEEDMWNEISANKEMVKQNLVPSLRHSIVVNYIDYMDDIAAINGNQINFLHLMLTDIRLAYQCFFGPVTPYQYRLYGPGKWDGARNAIMTAWDRTFFSIRLKRSVYDHRGLFFYKMMSLIVVVIAMCIGLCVLL